jgi:hypothetical protein
VDVQYLVMFMVGLMALRYYDFGWLSHLTKSDYLLVAVFRRIDDGITTSLTNIMQFSHWEWQMKPLPTLKFKLSCNVDLVLFP